MWCFEANSRVGADDAPTPPVRVRLTRVVRLVAVFFGVFAARCNERASGAEPPARASAALSLAPRLTALSVPARLREQSSELELSGLAYAPALGRYLLVSDDTGKKANGTAHAPWLFTMTASGELDQDPISIDGVERLNDAESISPGPDGTFFVCTSHSPNKKGQTPAERAMLLHLSSSAGKLHLLGRADLRRVGGDDEAGILRSAGLDPNGRLDIEGVAYRDGALFIGLKSPLKANGDAVVLRLSHPVEALKSGRIAAAELAHYADVRLSADGASGQVFEGISDLAFLPNGSLLILANSPKGMAKDAGGALFYVQNPRAGVLQAALVQRFPGLKPEGVSPAPDGKQIVVVFDRDRDAPAFMRLAVPR